MVSTAIRLTRMGRKKRPFYRLIAVDNRKRRDGAFLANLGFYNPFVDPYEAKLHEEEIIAWLKRGAVASDTAKALLRNQGILYRWSLVKQGLAKEEIEAKVAEWKSGSEARDAEKVRNKEAVKAKAAAVAKAAEDAAAAEAKAAEEAAAAEAKAAKEAAAAEAAAEEAPAEAAAEEAPAEAAAEEAPAEADAEPEKPAEG